MKNKIKTIILLACVMSAGIAQAQVAGTPYIPECNSPAQPGAFTSAPTCVTSLTYSGFLVYTVPSVANVKYIWTLPDGWTQVSGGNTNSITVSPGGTATNVTLSVAASNGCSTSVPLSVAIAYQVVPMPEFASRNLGADPAYDDPKSQMKYLASTAYINNSNRLRDGRVLGGEFEWGRDNKGNYAISTDGSYTTFGTSNRASVQDNATYDQNGQILTNNGVTSALDRFVIRSGTTPNDWRLSTPNGGQKDDLWGNGKTIDTPTGNFADKGILRSDGQYYQSPNWVLPVNNPCPSGWRVPTEDEWERLLNYECDGQNAATTASDVTITGLLWGATTTGFTWVSVSNDIPTRTKWAAGTGCGFAVYRTDVWNAAIAAGGYLAGLLQDGSNVNTVFSTKRLSDAGAPMPVLFLANNESGICPTCLVSTPSVYYLTSSPTGTNAYSLAIYNNRAIITSCDRSQNASIRCVKDPTMP